MPVLLDLARIDQHGVYVSMLALNAIDALDGRAKAFAKEIQALPQREPSVHRRMSSYVPRLIEKTLADLE